LSIIKPSTTSRAAETLVVPLGAYGFHILSDDGLLAALALWRAALGPLRLAGNAPRVSVLLNVRHATLERVAALGAEEVPVVPVFAKRHDMLAEDRCLTVPAARREEFVPIQMTVEPQPLVTVLGHRLARCCLEDFACCPTANAVEPRGAKVVWFLTDFEGLETCSA
jgi:hypothetical protein